MILRLATRSLATRPLRTAVLAVGFGLGIGVMAELLGVGEVILEQAHSPALQGGGDLVVAGAVGPVESARFLLSSVIAGERFRKRIRGVSPSRRATLYLMRPSGPIPVSVHGGIPSLERAVGDPETSAQSAWTDTPSDASWTSLPAGDVLRTLDRFHRLPRAADESFRRSWAEWLYFNGRSSDGRLRFYLTFLATAPNAGGTRPMVVRLQLNRDGRTTNYSWIDEVDEQELFERAPDVVVGKNQVRLDGLSYRIRLALAQDGGSRQSRVTSRQSRVTSRQSADVQGEIVLDAMPGRALPPLAIQGARGWVTGYVVPVLSGTFRGTLRIDGQDLSVDGLAGYHDHNWGFWEGVRWQWGQVAGDAASIVYGRVFPPSTVADPDRIPGFLAVLGPEGPIAYSTDVSIREDNAEGTPRTITIGAHGRQLNVDLSFDVLESVRTRSFGLTRSADESASMTFLQLGGVYSVKGEAAGRALQFTARGSAETFRPGAR